ncbi:MAG: peptide chain release factor N(5)-glutamine methyltransferase [Allorhizobium sp.]|uniref:Release factor glutamine methyltransferase n=1 Tax=Rhizobium rosettiformans TaxID=1368430 RepID=A0ABX7ERJ7_9HYPH|nr:peptide chain release factor N(5)-glutamine methyltransferase [Rhizobium rosettiformans]ODS58504.1 MAG: protein-(glutamine-N5) methyltransferase, release factor-specific [Agrobacterium sp. SCN 61-19]QRF50674.1 peptide chain release factor N(5)-glutamine methyltransferase [Rhizobium rosettiformans]
MDAAPSAKSLIVEARRRFEAAGLDDAAGDARVLVCGLLELSPTSLLLEDEKPVSSEGAARVEAGVLRRLAREPVHRILGRREFYGLDLALSAGTLEPRPDTEILVDVILPHLNSMVAQGRKPRLVDLGTGTGAIALALLHECPEAEAVGIDISEDALKTAADNAERNGLASRFATLAGPWFDKTTERFDLIVSNPPYIRSDVVKGLEPEVTKFDPMAALDGGPDGLDAYRAIAEGSSRHLEDQGLIGLEIGFDQREDVTQIFELAGFSLVEERRDYGDNDRVLVFAKRLD